MDDDPLAHGSFAWSTGVVGWVGAGLCTPRPEVNRKGALKARDGGQGWPRLPCQEVIEGPVTYPCSFGERPRSFVPHGSTDTQDEEPIYLCDRIA